MVGNAIGNAEEKGGRKSRDNRRYAHEYTKRGRPREGGDRVLPHP